MSVSHEQMEYRKTFDLGGAHPPQPQVSIIIPTYNPEERILSRVITAVEALERNDDSTIECVIVDNHSNPPVRELGTVKAFLDRCAWAKVIQEPRQGLTFSRLAGIKATTGPIIAVFDDDNEPAEDYLRTGRVCFETWPSVAIWGAGKIAVEFLDPVPKWIKQRFRGHFNERQEDHVDYGCVKAAWTHFYPIGMGQLIRRDVATRYVEAVEGGILSATDRKGKSLSGGGDTQLVWEAVKMGFAAGVHPEFRLTHLIPARRCSLSYLKRLTFGCASSYLPVLVQSFPSEATKLSKSIPSNWLILSGVGQIILRSLLRLRIRDLPVNLAHFLGGIAGHLRVVKTERRRWIFVLVRLLNLE